LISKLGSESSGNSSKHDVGKFQFFALEKMIETESTITVPLVVGYEVNWKMSAEAVGSPAPISQTFVAI